MAVAALLALGCAACTTTSGSAPGPTAAAGSGPTVTFESIDGPTESIFNQMVQSLTSEAKARQLAVVSRNSPAQYRVRVYAANVVYPNRSVIHWVWDVYDADQRRAFRITGEEPVTGAGHNTWAAADDQVVRRMSRAGMERLVASLAEPPASRPASPASPAAVPEPAPTPAVAPGETVAVAAVSPVVEQ